MHPSSIGAAFEVLLGAEAADGAASDDKHGTFVALRGRRRASTKRRARGAPRQSRQEGGGRRCFLGGASGAIHKPAGMNSEL